MFPTIKQVKGFITDNLINTSKISYILADAIIILL